MALGTSLRTVAALTLLLVGSVATYNVWVPRDQRVGPDWFRGSLVLLGPVLLALGTVLTILGPVAGSRSGPGMADNSPRWVLRAGLTLLLIGGFPWAYTPLLCGFGNEQSSGMLGTIIFLLVGLPGLAVTAIGVSLWWRHRLKHPDDPAPDGR